MAVSYKDIDLLSQKSSVAGTEKLPVSDTEYITPSQIISGKADKVSSATNGNFAGLDSNGNLTDSGSKASDFLTQHQSLAGYWNNTNSGTTSYDWNAKALTLDGAITGATSIDSLITLDTTNSRVGIGKSTPIYPLDVNGITRCRYTLFLDTAGTGNAGYIGRAGSNYNDLLFTAASGNELGLGTDGTDKRLLIDTSGNVGIGTSSPTKKLDVNGDINLAGSISGATKMTVAGDGGETIHIKNASGGNTNAGAILFQNSDQNGCMISSEYYGSGSRQSLVFSTSNNSTSPYTPSLTARMTILPNGRVGIGTSSPTQVLSVSGNIAATGTITTGSNAVWHAGNLKVSSTEPTSSDGSDGDIWIVV